MDTKSLIFYRVIQGIGFMTAILRLLAPVAVVIALWLLYRIARNLSISRYRKLRLIQVPFDEAHHLTEASVETVYWCQEETEALKGLLLRLPRDERSVLTMLYLENLSYAQAASALNMDEKRVDNLAYRGKRRLREWLRQEEREHE